MRHAGRALLTAVAALAACAPASSPVSTPSTPSTSTSERSVDTSPAHSEPVPEPVAEPAPTTPAPDELTCNTVRSSRAPGICGVLENAPRAEGPAVDKVVAIWRRLEPPFRALSGRETALVVLSPEARIGEGEKAKPLPPAAYICPGAPPTVYVPGSLLALVDDQDPSKYPDDFLAFVIGHELGHRMNDLTPDGCQLAAFQRPGKGVQEEELADARAAFFIASAGFSASRIARDDLVTRFLEAEYALGRTETQGRRDALLDALSRFDAYEALYQVALAVALGGELEAADRLLTWADELVQRHGVPLPELRVARAIVRIDHAAEMAPWGAELGIPVGIDHLRCAPVHPGHTGLREEPEHRVRGPDIERGKRLLREALELLAEAEARGATPLTVAAARACAAVYLGDDRLASAEQARAERLAATAPVAVKDALAGNRALVTFVEHARRHPPPSLEQGDELRAWADRLEAALGARASAPGFAAVIASLRDPDRPSAAPVSDAPRCTSTPAKPPAFPALSTSPAHGRCPAGYQLAHVLPSLDAAKNTGSTQGITVCRPAQGEGELATVRLVATTEPRLAALEQTMRWSRPPAELRALSTWACHCDRLERGGISDRGALVYRASCPALGLAHGVLVVDGGGDVETVIHHSR